jgi:hypothetical protein
VRDGKAQRDGTVVLARLVITDVVRDGERKIEVQSAELDTHEQVLGLLCRVTQEVLKARPQVSLYGEMPDPVARGSLR